MAKRVLFVGGGSGGHIAPLIAVMQSLHRLHPKVDMVYCGGQADLLSPVITETNLPFRRYAITTGKLHRFLTLRNIQQLSQLRQSVADAGALLDELQPDSIFSKGSMVGLPIALAAKKRQIPLFGHETDAAMGMTAAYCSRFAQTTFTSFPTKNYPERFHPRLTFVGQPIREAFFQPATVKVLEGRELDPSLPLVLVLCGSQGSIQVNSMVSAAWESLLLKYQIVQVTGELDLHRMREAQRQLPTSMQKRLHLFSFLTGALPATLQRARVVIGRSGGSIFEWAACGVPSLLFPLATAAQDHQSQNAKIFEVAGAALTVSAETSTSDLVQRINSLSTPSYQRMQMQENLKQFVHPHAAQHIAETIYEAI
jgi:UDP-N-acetylglucosamine--N-acetylmuramyl-(pentapeptide) pyrophosphoryl-undecaprenol N-acetylglucosamine transferase